MFNKKIVFMGSDYFLLPCLKFVLDKFNDVLVITTKNSIVEQFYSIYPYIGENKKSSLLITKNVNDNIETIKEFNPDYLIVVSFGQILNEELLNICKNINIHPSLLPKYRGATPLQTAFINRDKKVGISSIDIVKEIDAGDIYIQKEYALDPKTNYLNFYLDMSKRSVSILYETLILLENNVKPKKQEEYLSNVDTYCIDYWKTSKLNKQIDWKKSAEEILALIDVCNPAYTLYGNKRLLIYSAEIINVDINAFYKKQYNPGEIITTKDKGKFYLSVKCKDKLLSIKELQFEGKKRLFANEFLIGNKLEGFFS